MKTKVAIGISGGVDSAVSAALLKRNGYDVTGVYLHCFPESYQKTLDCTDKEDFKMSQKVSQALKIPFTFFDFEKDYQEKVIEYFFAEYQAGRTPNPDALCNKEIKFGLFLDKAITELRVDFVATGHYARIAVDSVALAGPAARHLAGARSANKPLRASKVSGSRHPLRATDMIHLLQGIDSTKDQSYFLYNLTQKKMSRIMFPVGGYTKKQVRQMARDFGLPNWDRKDSQGICFLGKVPVRKFLEQRIKSKRGEVIDTSGRVIGEHDGVWFYTIGQRHGFRVNRRSINLVGAGSVLSPASKDRLPRSLSLHPTPYTLHPNGPWYVIDKDIEKNRLIVGWGKECEKREFLVEKVNWMIGKPEDGKGCRVRIRHLGELYPCRLKINGKKVKVILKEPAWGVAPGQVAVFYRGEEVLGGGVIARAADRHQTIDQ